MPGVPGAGGPAPKRQRRNRSKLAIEPIEVEAGGSAAAPEADPAWHPIAAGIYRSLAESAQSALYEPSDWAVAALLAESMSRELSPQPVVKKDGEVVMVSRPLRGSVVSAWLKALTALLATEGVRRRARVEVQRAASDEDSSGDFTTLEDYRRRLHGSDDPDPDLPWSS